MAAAGLTAGGLLGGLVSIAGGTVVYMVLVQFVLPG